MTTIAPARTSHAHENLNILETVARAGWQDANVLRPDQVLGGVVKLLLGNQYICVRLVVNDGGDTGPLLGAIERDVLNRSDYLESYIILAGYPNAEIKSYKARLSAIKSKLVTAGSPEAFIVWLRGRLGPLAKLPLSSPLRKLAEPFRCAIGKPEPLEKRPIVGSYVGSPIEPSYALGQLGVQAIATLIGYTRSESDVINLEADRKWQRKDVDLEIREFTTLLNRILVEVKNEDKYTGNLVLEKYSKYAWKKDWFVMKDGQYVVKNGRYVKRPDRHDMGNDKTAGWFKYSEAECLVTCLWKSKDVVIFDMEKLREWVASRLKKIPLLEGTVPQQDYLSQFYCVDINEVLTDLPDAVHLRLSDWLPNLYGNQESLQPSLVHASVQSEKTLFPLRLDFA
jgi:hypothetical protein